jgi:hypothetical protein
MIENTLAFAHILTMGRYRSRRDKLGAAIGAFLHEPTQTAQDGPVRPRLMGSRHLILTIREKSLKYGARRGLHKLQG